MPLRIASALVLICLLIVPFRADASDPETMGILKQRAENFVECMLRGSVNSIAGEMHPGLRQTYSNEVVRNIFGDLYQRGGRFEEMGEASLSIGRNTSVTAMIPLRYVNNTVTARLVFERAGIHSRITEFAILPYTEPDPDNVWLDPDAPPKAPQPLPSPPYANSLLFGTETLELTREGMEPLSSSLYMPTIATETSPVPAIILVAEPNTTGELPMVGTSNPLRDIAEGLATRGVAVMLVVPNLAQADESTEDTTADAELDEAPEVIIIAESEAEADATTTMEETPETEVAGTEPAPKTLAEAVSRIIESRPQIDKARVFEIYRNQPLTRLGSEEALLADSNGFAFKTFAYHTEEQLEAGTIPPSSVFHSAVFRSAEDTDAIVDASIDNPFPAERRYPNTGPYLIEEITEGDTTRYGHVARAFIEDTSHFARTGRFP